MTDEEINDYIAEIRQEHKEEVSRLDQEIKELKEALKEINQIARNAY
jgi:phage host-nuclease inhibitor protein Gam